MSILDQTANEKVEAGYPGVSFLRPGDAIVAQFRNRKTGIKTKHSKSDDDLACVSEVLIVNSTIPDVKPGELRSLWEGMHVRQYMDEWQLQRGEGFLVRFAETKGKFKSFFGKKLTETELAEEAETKGVTLEATPF